MAKLQVEAIINGSVIDHIPAGQGINILKHFKMLDTQKSGAKISWPFLLPELPLILLKIPRLLKNTGQNCRIILIMFIAVLTVTALPTTNHQEQLFM